MDDPARNPSDETFHIDYDDFKMQIRYYGKQCDSNQIKPGGLGTYFTSEIMDNFSYCTERVKGTLLTMVKN